MLEHPWAFLNKLFGGGPKEVYADFFGILTVVTFTSIVLKFTIQFIQSLLDICN